MPQYQMIEPTPPTPPEIRAQQAPPAAPSSVMMAAGQQAGMSDPVTLLEQKVSELERWAGEMAQLIQVAHPPAAALLVPIAQAGKALQQQIAQLRERKGAPTAVGMGAPGMRPNPAEGVPTRPI